MAVRRGRRSTRGGGGAAAVLDLTRDYPGAVILVFKFKTSVLRGAFKVAVIFPTCPIQPDAAGFAFKTTPWRATPARCRARPHESLGIQLRIVKDN